MDSDLTFSGEPLDLKIYKHENQFSQTLFTLDVRKGDAPVFRDLLLLPFNGSDVKLSSIYKSDQSLSWSFVSFKGHPFWASVRFHTTNVSEKSPTGLAAHLSYSIHVLNDNGTVEQTADAESVSRLECKKI